MDGVDLSPESLRRTSRIADRAGADIKLIEANVYDTREAVEGDFDVVDTSLGTGTAHCNPVPENWTFR